MQLSLGLLPPPPYTVHQAERLELRDGDAQKHRLHGTQSVLAFQSDEYPHLAPAEQQGAEALAESRCPLRVWDESVEALPHVRLPMVDEGQGGGGCLERLAEPGVWPAAALLAELEASAGVSSLRAEPAAAKG